MVLNQRSRKCIHGSLIKGAKGDQIKHLTPQTLPFQTSSQTITIGDQAIESAHQLRATRPQPIAPYHWEIDRHAPDRDRRHLSLRQPQPQSL